MLSVMMLGSKVCILFTRRSFLAVVGDEETELSPAVLFKEIASNGAPSVYLGTVSDAGYSSSAQGREAPVGRSISGRGHFGPREDTVGTVQCSVRLLKMFFFC